MIVTAAVFAIALLALVAFAPGTSRVLAMSAGSRRALFGTDDQRGSEPAEAPTPPPSVPRPRVSPEDLGGSRSAVSSPSSPTRRR